MKTPIVDFVKSYIKSDMSRFHMPGHKGQNLLGFEKYDITEISGADVLSEADGIINESEELASSLFKTCHTYYTTEGSSTAICAMLALVTDKDKNLILAARNVHKAFIHACALLDLEVDWLISQSGHIAKCEISSDFLENQIKKSKNQPAAVYLTSPDYLGNIQNIPEIARVCKKYDIPLLVDNAHGAYLAFLKEPIHPICSGATLCCDSAHKTLPVLTGGAYLHVAKDAPSYFKENARDKLALFSSTSPSYLILQSLDLCNNYLSDGYKERLEDCIKKIDELKEFIISRGFFPLDSEKLKIVLNAKASGYTGYELADFLRQNKIEAEFYDEDFLVLMITPENTIQDFRRLESAFEKILPKQKISERAIKILPPVTKMSIRDAILSESEIIDVSSALGRILASFTVSCPPAVPITISGEEITKDVIELFKTYGINKIRVVKQ